MTRTITASEVKPGMTIRAEYLGVTHELTVSYVESARGLRGAEARTGLGGSVYLSGRKPVTVLSEPAPVQPEEPTEFGARVVVDGTPALRTQDGADEVDPDEGPWRVRSGRNTWADMTWAEVCALGSVTVVPDQGWTAPADTPEVPERIEEWPEDDHTLRAFMWWDRYGCVWMWNAGYSKWECHNAAGDYLTTVVRPVCGPWTRVTDAW